MVSFEVPLKRYLLTKLDQSMGVFDDSSNKNVSQISGAEGQRARLPCLVPPQSSFSTDPNLPFLSINMFTAKSDRYVEPLATKSCNRRCQMYYVSQLRHRVSRNSFEGNEDQKIVGKR